MEYRWEFTSLILQMLVLGGVSFVIGLFLWYELRKITRNPDAQWEKHVDSLLAKGIDPSYIKRTPEWVAKQENENRKHKYLAVLLSVVIPVILLVGIAITVVSMWNTFGY